MSAKALIFYVKYAMLLAPPCNMDKVGKGGGREHEPQAGEVSDRAGQGRHEAGRPEDGGARARARRHRHHRGAEGEDREGQGGEQGRRVGVHP